MSLEQLEFILGNLFLLKSNKPIQLFQFLICEIKCIRLKLLFLKTYKLKKVIYTTMIFSINFLLRRKRDILF